MSITIENQTRTLAGKEVAVVIISGPGTYAEVWPAMGFNCLRWKVHNDRGELADLIYCDPGFENNPVPTRSGHPILFPFPNRLNQGKMHWNGKDYQLPLNDATNTHAIHGFTPRNPWRLVGTTANETSATITGEFQLSVDLPEALHHWPSDFIIRVEYQFSLNQLQVKASVHNPGNSDLPFGLGYHPYFQCPNGPNATVDDMVLTLDVRDQWILENSIPTGQRTRIPEEFDFRRPKPIGSLSMDVLFGGSIEGVAVLGHRTAPGCLIVERISPDFREFLVFTPPHRKAVALEPYTCATDAANLQHRGLDAGWQSLAPGKTWIATVRYRWHPEPAGPRHGP